MNFAKIDKGFVQYPFVTGPNVFTAEEYWRATGIGSATAYKRLRAMLAAGKVRKVKTQRKGTKVIAWEYLEK